MGYYNPIYSCGVDRFLKDALAAGIDGLIVVDLPPEEDDELCIPAQKVGLNFIRLATPTTDARRLPKVLQNTSGFVYYVSVTGITGAAAAVATDVGPEVARIKRSTDLPVRGAGARQGTVGRGPFGLTAPRRTRVPAPGNSAGTAAQVSGSAGWASRLASITLRSAASAGSILSTRSIG